MKKVVLLLFVGVSFLAALMVIYERDSGREKVTTADSGSSSEEGLPESRTPRLSYEALSLGDDDIDRVSAVANAGQEEVALGPMHMVEDVASDQEAAFLTDSPANASAKRTEASLIAAFDDYKANGAQLTDIQCRATRCRMEVELRDETADNLVGAGLQSKLILAGIDVSQLGFLATRDVLPDDSRKLIAYLYQQ